MDEKLRLSIAPLCLSFFSVSEVWSKLCSMLKDAFIATRHKPREQLLSITNLLERVSVAQIPPPYLEFMHLASIITIGFVNCDDVQLLKKLLLRVFFHLLCFPVFPCGFALHVTPGLIGKACKIQRAALQTSWNLLCVYSNNFTPWLFYQAAAAMHVILPEGILYGKTYWKVKVGFFLVFFSGTLVRCFLI